MNLKELKSKLKEEEDKATAEKALTDAKAVENYYYGKEKAFKICRSWVDDLETDSQGEVNKSKAKVTVAFWRGLFLGTTFGTIVLALILSWLRAQGII